MRNIRLFILAGVASFLMVGCVYGPHIAHIPIYEQKGDMQVSGALSVWDGVSASAGVAVTDHFALQTMSSVTPFNGVINTQTSLGYYNAFDNHTMLGIYGGYGNCNGWEYFDHGDSMGGTFVSDNRLFVQVDYGWMKQSFGGIAGRLTAGYMQSGLFFLEPALDIPIKMGPLYLAVKFSCMMISENYGDTFPIPNVGLGVSYNFNFKE
ncbi:MAG: hypothetical protein MJZ62_00775 [Bacteroidales bacterium]|nr:hypothetical protein [Bacteroidales bacterium]